MLNCSLLVWHILIFDQKQMKTVTKEQQPQKTQTD